MMRIPWEHSPKSYINYTKFSSSEVIFLKKGNLSFNFKEHSFELLLPNLVRIRLFSAHISSVKMVKIWLMILLIEILLLLSRGLNWLIATNAQNCCCLCLIFCLNLNKTLIIQNYGVRNLIFWELKILLSSKTYWQEESWLNGEPFWLYYRPAMN